MLKLDLPESKKINDAENSLRQNKIKMFWHELCKWCQITDEKCDKFISLITEEAQRTFISKLFCYEIYKILKNFVIHVKNGCCDKKMRGNINSISLRKSLVDRSIIYSN